MVIRAFFNNRKMIKTQYFNMEYPILGIKRITIGWNWLSYNREVNPVTNKLIRKGWYIKYITKLINKYKQ